MGGAPWKDPFIFSECLPVGLCLAMLWRYGLFGPLVAVVGNLAGVWPGIAGVGHIAESLSISEVGRQPFNVMLRTTRLEAGGGR